MNDKFVHLEAPYGFKSFYTKYPEGYSIFEALLNWLDEVNKMIDTLNITLEEWANLKTWINAELKDIAQEQLEAWLTDGTLEDLINQVLFNSKLDKSVFEDFVSEVETDIDLINTHKADKTALTNLETNKVDKIKLQQKFYNVSDFGVLPSNSGVLNSENIQNLINDVEDYSTIFIPSGVYQFDDTILIDKPLTLEGTNGRYRSGVEEDSINFYIDDYEKPAVKILGGIRNVIIRNLKIVNKYVVQDAESGIGYDPYGIGVLIGDGILNVNYCVNITIDNVTTSLFNKGFSQNVAWFVEYKNCVANTSWVGFYIGGHATSTTYQHCYANGANHYGYHINSLQYGALINCACDYSFRHAYFIVGSNGITMTGCGNEKTSWSSIALLQKSDVTVISQNSSEHARANNTTYGSLIHVADNESYATVIGCVEHNNVGVDVPSFSGGGTCYFANNRTIKKISPTLFRVVDGTRASTSKPTTTDLPVGTFVTNISYNGSGAFGWLYNNVGGVQNWVDIGV